MHTQSSVHTRTLPLLIILCLGLFSLFAAPASADDSCIIPESGPWPACATGGSSAPPAAGSADCVIPEVGPWPPCATGGEAAAPANSSTDSECVIPASGPWPACATGGSGATASDATVPSGPTHAVITTEYDLVRTRALFLAVLNEDLGMGARASSAWQADSSIEIADGNVRLVSFADTRHELVTSISAEAGSVSLTIEVLEISYNRQSGAALTDLEGQIERALDARLKAQLGSDRISRISAENGVMTVTNESTSSSVGPIADIQAASYSNEQVRILMIDALRKIGIPIEWQAASTLTLDFRQVHLSNTYWDGSQQRTVELKARLGAANGDPIVGLDVLNINYDAAPQWQRAQVEQALAQAFTQRFQADLNYTTVVAVAAEGGELVVTYR